MSLDRWRTLWDAEIAGLPSHRESRFWLVAGLLLPIWDCLPDESMRVRRLVADDGKHLIGRVLGPAEVSEFRTALGLDGDPGLTAAEVRGDGRDARPPAGARRGSTADGRGGRYSLSCKQEGPIYAHHRRCPTEIRSGRGRNWTTPVFSPGPRQHRLCTDRTDGRRPLPPAGRKTLTPHDHCPEDGRRVDPDRAGPGSGRKRGGRQPRKRRGREQRSPPDPSAGISNSQSAVSALALPSPPRPILPALN